MKKIILLAPVAMFSLLTSCNNPPKNYLSLWSKMTSTLYISDPVTDTAICETTRKIENKKVVYEELKNITEKSNRLHFETYKKTYQYNDHGDLKYMESITTDSLKNAAELKHTETHDYHYNSKGLIDWHKIVVKNVISSNNDIIPDTTEIESEYDKYDRCTKEKTYYVKEKKRTLIKDVVTEYPENNFDNFIEQVEIKCDEFEGTPYLKTITTNTLDDKGYILRQFVTNYSLVENENNARPIPSDSFTYVERDKYHCATSVKVYSALERIESNLVSELKATYWKNNPERVETYIYDYPDEYGEARYHDEVAIKYDDYGRISERTTDQSIDFDGRIITHSEKDVLEYDQLIVE